jgi:hypothetical protein
MAESKFDRLFQRAEPAPAAPPPEQSPPAPLRRRRETPPPAARAPVGRPPGKRSDPAWKQFSVLLKKETQREATSLLRAKEEGLDLSGLIQKLLENWVARQKS